MMQYRYPSPRRRLALELVTHLKQNLRGSHVEDMNPGGFVAEHTTHRRSAIDKFECLLALPASHAHWRASCQDERGECHQDEDETNCGAAEQWAGGVFFHDLPPSEFRTNRMVWIFQ